MMTRPSEQAEERRLRRVISERGVGKPGSNGASYAADNLLEPLRPLIEVKAAAHYVTEARGGHGAVREVVTMILKAQNQWGALVREYTE